MRAAGLAYQGPEMAFLGCFGLNLFTVMTSKENTLEFPQLSHVTWVRMLRSRLTWRSALGGNLPSSFCASIRLGKAPIICRASHWAAGDFLPPWTLPTHLAHSPPCCPAGLLSLRGKKGLLRVSLTDRLQGTLETAGFRPIPPVAVSWPWPHRTLGQPFLQNPSLWEQSQTPNSQLFSCSLPPQGCRCPPALQEGSQGLGSPIISSELFQHPGS